MFKQLLVNLITVVAAISFLAVATGQVYFRISPYEECMRSGGSGFGVDGFYDVSVRHKNLTAAQAWRLILTEECKNRTHF
jgi:hypothetical protein